jgi:hypothetical protein
VSLRPEKLKTGRFFAASRDKLEEMAQRFSMRRVANLAGCAAP